MFTITIGLTVLLVIGTYCLLFTEITWVALFGVDFGGDFTGVLGLKYVEYFLGITPPGT